jgi:hypothetical protein
VAYRGNIARNGSYHWTGQAIFRWEQHHRHYGGTGQTPARHRFDLQIQEDLRDVQQGHFVGRVAGQERTRQSKRLHTANEYLGGTSRHALLMTNSYHGPPFGEN